MRTRPRSGRPTRSSLLRYRETRTRPKYRAAQALLSAAGDASTERHPRVHERAARVLNHLQGHIDRVIPHIHDLWCENRFQADEGALDIVGGGSNPFLKPLSDFDQAQLRFERTVALLDMCSLAEAVHEWSDPRVAGSRPCQSPRLWAGTDRLELARSIAAWTRSPVFLRRVAASTHRNWLEARRLTSHGPVAVRDFAEPTPDGCPRAWRLLLENTRCNVLAVALFCAGSLNSDPFSAAHHVSSSAI